MRERKPAPRLVVKRSTLDRIYDDAFFAVFGRENAEYARAAAFIGEEIFRRFAPRTVVDWGCGSGLHAGALSRCGARVIGVDGVRIAVRQRDPDVDYRQADLTRVVPSHLTFADYDLSLCIDVLEHLADEDSGIALANITRGAGLVILSCAPPGQGGHHHVNERPRRYWVRRMADMGWRYDRPETGRMERFFRAHAAQVPLTWMYHNLCVYRPAR